MEQKFQEFLNKWNNRYISVLNPGRQCFDVVVAWTDLLGIPHFPNNPSPFPYQYAYQIYENFNNFQAQYFDRIGNGAFNSPQIGDIIVWKPGYNGGAGHTGLSIGKNGLFTFDGFVQNDPIGTPAHIKTYGYGYLQNSGIYGWLHPKNYNLPLTSEQKVSKVIAVLNGSETTDTDKVNKIRTILGV